MYLRMLKRLADIWCILVVLRVWWGRVVIFWIYRGRLLVILGVRAFLGCFWTDSYPRLFDREDTQTSPFLKSNSSKNSPHQPSHPNHITNNQNQKNNYLPSSHNSQPGHTHGAALNKNNHPHSHPKSTTNSSQGKNETNNSNSNLLKNFQSRQNLNNGSRHNMSGGGFRPGGSRGGGSGYQVGYQKNFWQLLRKREIFVYQKKRFFK